jgi:hypothetical protein
MEREAISIDRGASVATAPQEIAAGCPESDLIRQCATNLLEPVPDLAVAMARHIHEHVPELDPTVSGLECSNSSGATGSSVNISRIGRIPEPIVPSAPSKYAIQESQ